MVMLAIFATICLVLAVWIVNTGFRAKSYAAGPATWVAVLTPLIAVAVMGGITVWHLWVLALS